MAQSVVVLEKDPALASILAMGLGRYFSVHLTRSREELRGDLDKIRAQAVILNIDEWPLADVERLHHDLPALSIVCTHRIPDDELWTAALAAGASDVCYADDVQSVLNSVRQSLGFSNSAVA